MVKSSCMSTGSFGGGVAGNGVVIIGVGVDVSVWLVFGWQYCPSAGRLLMHPHVFPTMTSQVLWVMQLLYDQAKLSSHMHWYPITFDEHTVVMSVLIISISTVPLSS